MVPVGVGRVDNRPNKHVAAEAAPEDRGARDAFGERKVAATAPSAWAHHIPFAAWFVASRHVRNPAVARGKDVLLAANGAVLELVATAGLGGGVDKGPGFGAVKSLVDAAACPDVDVLAFVVQLCCPGR